MPRSAAEIPASRDCRRLLKLMAETRRLGDRCQTAKTNGHRWLTAVEVVENTARAVSAYRRMPWRRTDGSAELCTHGLLQCLVMQQEAARSLCAMYNVSFDTRTDRGLTWVRKTRDELTGHPTDPKRTSAYALGRRAWSRWQIAWLPGESSVSGISGVPLKSLVTRQQLALETVFKSVISTMRSGIAVSRC